MFYHKMNIRGNLNRNSNALWWVSGTSDRLQKQNDFAKFRLTLPIKLAKSNALNLNLPVQLQNFSTTECIDCWSWLGLRIFSGCLDNFMVAHEYWKKRWCNFIQATMIIFTGHPGLKSRSLTLWSYYFLECSIANSMLDARRCCWQVEYLDKF